ncbi:MAG: hypothetical protein K2O15_10465, partial [Lachnospiraceae bacterium]|nr:hypothetical protein [Lachnospiraceae bacterium]
MSPGGTVLEKRESIRHGLLRAVVVVMCAMLLSACGSEEEENPMGRYADREVKLPGAGYEYMHPCPDGGYYLFGNDADLTHVAADGTVSR